MRRDILEQRHRKRVAITKSDLIIVIGAQQTGRSNECKGIGSR